MQYDYNNPIKANEIEVLDYSDNGKSKVTKFKYDGRYFTQRYNYGANWGFKFIEEYKTAEHQQKPLSQQGELIYSSTLQSNCTPFGTYLEYSLMKTNAFKAATI